MGGSVDYSTFAYIGHLVFLPAFVLNNSTNDSSLISKGIYLLKRQALALI